MKSPSLHGERDQEAAQKEEDQRIRVGSRALLYRARPQERKEDEGKDEALPQRVKSELGRFFNVSDLDITNREGVITLRGGVPNEQERQNMIDMAKKIKGVREVVNMLY